MSRVINWQEAKDPSDVDIYGVDVDTDWLGDETIASATFIPNTNSGLTIGSPAIQGNEVRALFSGGYVGCHRIEVTITTISGRVRQRTLPLVVEEL